MTEEKKAGILPYLGAVGIVVAATLFRLAVDPFLGDRQPFAAFLVAVVVTARFCGFKPSLLTLFLSGFAARYFFMLPRGEFGIAGTVQQVSFTFFLLFSLLFTFLMRAEQRVRRNIRREIDERERAEHALRDSEERFRLLAMHAPVGIIQSDAVGRTFFVNSKWCEIAGAAPEEVMNYGWQQFLHPEDRPGLIESWNAAMADGRTYFSAEFRFQRKDGSIRQARSTASLIHDAHGVPIGQIGIIEDVTERNAAAEKIRTRESQLSGILDNAPAVIYLKDSEGRYLLTNRRFRELIERDGRSIVGMTDREYFPEAIARTFQSSDAAIWQTRGPLNFEEDAPHADGLHTYRSVKFPVRDEAGRMIALGGISTDISDLKEAHEALKDERELLRNLIDVQEKEKQFLCHEFHDGLMQYAVGSLMSLSSYQEKHPSSEAAATIDRVIGDLSKGVEDGRRAMRGIRPAVLDDFGLDAAIDDLTEQFSGSGILVTSKCDPEIGRLPNGIQTTVYRVVQEALNNARKHSGTDVIRIELKKIDGRLELEIRDFGCGFHVASARKNGFGLLGMTERVRLLGGECLIQSELEAGTRIFVRLPIPAAGDEAAPVRRTT